MPFAALADGFRIATLHAELTRKGPGLLLRDIERDKNKQIDALRTLNAAVHPDVLLLTKVDFDLGQRSAKALQDVLGYKYFLTVPPNTMVPIALDLDGNGSSGDRQTWVRYAGEGGMLLLSEYPLRLVMQFNDLLWKDFSEAPMAVDANGNAFPSKTAQDIQKLVSQGMWVVDVALPDGDPITLLTFQNQTPVFDGPEDLNGLRNLGQLKLLKAIIVGEFGKFPKRGFIAIGNTNLDPSKGGGSKQAMADLLADPRIQDARPESELGGRNTAIWEKPGPMRVSYILPSADWKIDHAKVVWPREGPLRDVAEQASRHRMVWMDIRR